MRLFGLFITVISIVLSPSAYANQDTMIRKIAQEQIDEKALTDAVASRTLSWLTGSSSNNDYVSVGRTANYFGFVGLRVASGHSLSRSLVAKQTLSVLTSAQRDTLLSLVDTQKPYSEQVAKSRSVMNRALEGLLVDEPISEQTFITLGATYGQHEAMLGRIIALTFGEIMQSLTDEQKQRLDIIRQAHLTGKGQTIPFEKIKIKLSKEDKKEITKLSSSATQLVYWKSRIQ
ncbi:hypothetical protein JCM19239_6847 [Vibrio variabilis]|uniref:DUF4142 domain-containing protein n=1 Tax=Vibrio variabilis TaxID=990271 RepID=A0ABQ0JP71_9VIBR|nr:hypothetical protein JCM19239_6847 [Vibrio variabilis]